MRKTFLLMLSVAAIATAAQSSRADTWRGTAPFCKGQCLPGEREIQRSKSGNGASCWSGTKVLCAGGGSSAPACQGGQTKTYCYGVVQVCENGTYSIPDVWHGCGRYACGVCIGLSW